MAGIDIHGELADKTVNTIRMLAVDAVEKAGCGHPGLPMGAADFAFVLWTQFLRFDPDDPKWANRDRFLLSAGHGSMLLYSMLHLFGYDMPIEELKNFRQLDSKTPGHPEYDIHSGVETTTGPLGQGFGNGVGMAIAAKMSAARFNTNRSKIVDNNIFALCSDGDLMEGVSHEAASLAGHLKLNNLVYYYDDNNITIEGGADLAYSDDAAKRFEGYHWYVQRVDGHDRDALKKAVENAVAEPDRPSIIVARTHIGYGSPNKQDTADAHGAALGEEEVKLTKKNLGWPLEPEFLVPDDVRELCSKRVKEVKAMRAEWDKLYAEWRKAEPEKAQLWDTMLEKRTPEDLTEKLLLKAEVKKNSTRKASGATLQAAADLIPSLVGGSADLAPSTNTILNNYGHIAPGSFDGRNFHYGVREHGMGAVVNGMAKYGGFIPYGATFLVFSDYMRPTVRLAAISKAQSIFVFTHDSVFVGEDGPTHQGVEHVAALRAIPQLTVIRPCDGPETAAAWAAAIEKKDGPTALILTRQNVPAIDRNETASAAELKKGAYTLLDAYSGKPEVIIIATGSEVAMAVGARKKLEEDGIPTRVVSMPSFELFEEQSSDYKESVLPHECSNRVAVEAGASFGWHKYVGPDGLCLCIDHFGESAPYEELEKRYGFTPEQIFENVKKWYDAK